MNNLPKSLIETGVVAAIISMDEVSQVITMIKSQEFAGPAPDVSSLSYNLGNGLELTVTAGVHSGGANAPLDIIDSADIIQKGGNKPGIGVRSGQASESSQLDTFGPNEFLRFSFNQEVTLLSTIFEDASNTGAVVDELDIGIDGINLQITSTFGTDTLRFFPESGFLGLTERLVDFSGGVNFNGYGSNGLFPAKGLVFDFYTENRNGSFRIREIQVAVDVPEYMSTFSILTFAILDAILTLKCKLNPSKSIKKELEKIS